jgi:hypothetical protein
MEQSFLTWGFTSNAVALGLREADLRLGFVAATTQIIRPGGERARTAVRRAEGRLPDATPRMQGMLGEVRRRALALAGCFCKASRLARGPTGRAWKWKAMAQVPVEIVERIATLAKISIVAVDFVE